MKLMFDVNDYRKLNENETYENKFVILDPKQFKPEYQTAQFQLYYAECGFGCDPSKIGGAIFGRLVDERYNTRREYVLGVATEDAIQSWEKAYSTSREVFLKEV